MNLTNIDPVIVTSQNKQMHVHMKDNFLNFDVNIPLADVHFICIYKDDFLTLKYHPTAVR